MRTITDEVTVKLQDAQGKENVIPRPVSYVELETAEDVLNFLSTAENVPLLLAAANYGFNLKARAKVTAQIKAENQGPEVAINRAVKQIVANKTKFGKPVDEAEIRAHVLANLELFGIEG